MQMLGHDCTREYNEIAVCTCGKNCCQYNTYKTNTDMLYGWLKHHEAALLAVMWFLKWGNSCRALTSMKLNFPYVYMKAVSLGKIQFKTICKKAYRLGSDIYRLDLTALNVQKDVIVVLDAEFGTILHSVWCPMHFRVWKAVVHPSHWDDKKTETSTTLIESHSY